MENKMFEKIGILFLLVVSVIGMIIVGSDVIHYAGIMPVGVYTVSVLGFSAGVYALFKA
tara:strand:- start:328 stop:504 length:177 start_codon:yes stop_codon:yes gene_type:complete